VAAAVVLAATAGAADASERSERLVAQGQAAALAGRLDDARARFAEAVEADPADAVAAYELGLALTRLERWDEAADALERARRLRPRFEQAERALAAVRRRENDAARRDGADKPWQIRATTGLGYDSNVKVSPGGQFAPIVGQRHDIAWVLGGGGSYDLVRREDTLVRVDYDLYQTLHPELDDFDFRSHQVRATASRALTPALWAGVQGGYNHDTLGPHSYLSEPYVMPFLSLLEGSRGVTQVLYRRGDDTYLSQPFHEVRDGPNDATGVSQTLTADGRSLTVGYLYASERPRSARGDDYRLASHQGFLGLDFPCWWSTDVALAYQLRYDGYTEPNSVVDFRKRRHDLVNDFHAGVSREIVPHVRAAILYYWTQDDSNIAEFDYVRHIVTGVLQITY
jgi:hypothetical protein